MKGYHLIWLFVLAIQIAGHSFRCLFDHHNQDLRQKSSKETPDVPVHPPIQTVQGRLLTTPSPVRAPMKIELVTTTFSDPIQTPLNGASATTTTNLNFVLKTMQVAATFYQSRLQVGSMASITPPSPCVDYTPPSTTAFAGVDLVLFVLYITDQSQTYGATGKSCKYFEGTVTAGNPDLTLQIGRPTVGRIIFNTYNLVDRESSLTNRLFQSITSTALHETLHILGFDSTLYSSYLDPATGLHYSATTILGTVNSNRNATTFLTTPYVLAWAKDFFNCSSLTGMPLQNQDGTGLGAGSHWQRTAMYDELMTGTALGTAKYFSGLSFALLKDTGWYTVDDRFVETSNYGYKKGCSFLTEACYGTNFSEFCSVSTSTNISFCDSNFIGKAVCSNSASMMSDGCGMYGQYFSCIDSNSQDSSYQAYSFEVYNSNSFCLDSTLGSVVLPSNLQSRCYTYVCGTSSIIFTIGTYTITCLSTEAGTKKTLSALAGYLTCPDYTNFCVMSRKTCPNFCNKNGYCMNGVCNCYEGYFGPTCTITTCTTGQYYNPTTATCLTQCLSGYYANVFSRSCEPCKAPCSECANEPTNCVGCQPIGGVIQYYYNSNCYSACPDGTYALPNATCLTCNTGLCKTCTGSATACTSCNSPLYLSQPVSGTCVSSCSGAYSYYNEVTMVCVSSCDSNQLTLANSSCVLCAASSYFYQGQCNATCDNGFYADETQRACLVCDSTCLTCDGSYPENCTSCKPTGGNNYLLHKMCWAICPKGFYANPTTYKCQVCPVQLSCSSCSYNSTAIAAYCTMCSYGTFYQASNQTCGSGCLSTQYKNTWNNSCNQCDSACATCIGPTSSSCTSCANTFYLLSNSTGGYCLSSCPVTGYIQIGSQCQSCDSTCSSCNGVDASNCYNCSTNYYFYSGYCRYVCPNGTYPSSTTWQCLNCDSTCSYCFDSGNSSCTSCASGLYLYNFTCTGSCPNGMTPNQWNVCFQFHVQFLYLTILTILLLTVY